MSSHSRVPLSRSHACRATAGTAPVISSSGETTKSTGQVTCAAHNPRYQEPAFAALALAAWVAAALAGAYLVLKKRDA